MFVKTYMVSNIDNITYKKMKIRKWKKMLSSIIGFLKYEKEKV